MVDCVHNAYNIFIYIYIYMYISIYIRIHYSKSQWCPLGPRICLTCVVVVDLHGILKPCALSGQGCRTAAMFQTRNLSHSFPTMKSSSEVLSIEHLTSQRMTKARLDPVSPGSLRRGKVGPWSAPQLIPKQTLMRVCGSYHIPNVLSREIAKHGETPQVLGVETLPPVWVFRSCCSPQIIKSWQTCALLRASCHNWNQGTAVRPVFSPTFSTLLAMFWASLKFPSEICPYLGRVRHPAGQGGK